MSPAVVLALCLGAVAGALIAIVLETRRASPPDVIEKALLDALRHRRRPSSSDPRGRVHGDYPAIPPDVIEKALLDARLREVARMNATLPDVKP